MSFQSFASMCASSRRRSVVPARAERQSRLALDRAEVPPLRSPAPSARVTAVPTTERILPPSPALLALEGRAWLEFAALVPALPLLARAPRGDGHPVLVLPGWMASDRSTWALRRFLRDRGYHAHGWRLGRNLGPDPDTVAGLGERFRLVRARHGRK